jgi:hypothetical protein
MRRLVALAFAAIAGGTATGCEDYVAGTASYSGGRGAVTFEAWSGPGGERPLGLATWQELFGQRPNGPVTCLNVTGRRATIGFGGLVGGPGGLLYVEDNLSGVDNLKMEQVATSPTTCPANTVVYDPLDDHPTGDFTVRDNGPVTPHPRRIVGAGSLTGDIGGTASYAYRLNCHNPTRTVGQRFRVRFGDERFRLTSVTTAGCASRAVFICPGAGSEGIGTGTLSSGEPATIAWILCDGGASQAPQTALQISNASGSLFSEVPPSPPGPFRGEPGHNTVIFK